MLSENSRVINVSFGHTTGLAFSCTQGHLKYLLLQKYFLKEVPYKHFAVRKLW